MLQKLFKKWSIKYAAALVFGALALSVIGAWLFISADIFYQDRVYPGIFVGDLAVGGKTADQLKIFLTQETGFLNQGVEFFSQDKKVIISPSSVSFDGDLAYQLFSVNIEATTKSVMAFGRGDSWFDDGRQKIWCAIFGCRLPLVIDYNQPKIIELLMQEFSSLESSASDAKLNWRTDGQWLITPEKFGRRFDYQAATAVFLDNLRQVKNTPIKLILEEDAPEIFHAEVGNLEERLERFFSAAPVIFKFSEKEWTVNKNDIRSWLGLKAFYHNGVKEVVVDVDNDLLGEYLNKRIAPSINQDAQEAKFVMKDGRVSLFHNSRDGQEIDIVATAQNLRRVLNEEQSAVEIVVSVIKASTSGADANSLGIVEIIGTGTSSFAGSPANRRHNIKIGAAALNGLLVAAGEEFSLLKALGKIDAKAGYLPELVIKQNKTIPEYGGGLCQIGTTAFRAVVNTGLPVTMRRNHSYRVSYYEPAGTDATIYDPWPDFKFINDTADYILIQTKISGDTLIFDFWGRRDGRQVEVTKPVIYNIVKPPPTKIVETVDLKPGEKKCTEKAHNGASAYFDYTVIYASGEVKKERFSSYYVPWQEVCLVGVEKTAEPINEETATSTTP